MAKIVIHTTLNLIDFIELPHPNISEEANAAANGAVIAEDKPAAQNPIDINVVAQLPSNGSN